MRKKYGVIFFDWDGTAVLSRGAPVGEITAAMTPLLEKGVKLAVVSGTDYGNIADGKFAEFFPPALRAGLYFGLGRGAENYFFAGEGRISLGGIRPTGKTMAVLHGVCFQLHRYLFEHYGCNTDIVFSRGNYCKIDLMPDLKRKGMNYFRKDELARLNGRLAEYGYTQGIKGLFALALKIGKQNGLSLKATTDAKYLELGFGTKSDNVDMIFSHIQRTCGITAEDCCFWGDEFLKMDDGIFGSDAFMITEKTKNGDFFDVSDAEGERPRQVNRLGGGVKRFMTFLYEQYGML